MADILVEDGTGVLNANSFVSEEYAEEYFDEMANYEWSQVAEPGKMLIVATRYLVTRFGLTNKFRGVAQYPDLGYLPFPRLYIGSDDLMPVPLKQATCEYALLAGKAATAGMMGLAPNPTSSTDQVAYTRKKIGPMEKEIHYATGPTANALPTFPAYPYADALLRPLLRYAGGVIR